MSQNLGFGPERLAALISTSLLYSIVKFKCLAVHYCEVVYAQTAACQLICSQLSSGPRSQHEYLSWQSFDTCSMHSVGYASCLSQESLFVYQSTVRSSYDTFWCSRFSSGVYMFCYCSHVVQDTDSSQGRLVPHGLDVLQQSVNNAEDCRQAVDLLQHMLRLEPSQRLSTQAALSHPFLQV